jgi:hypothetical protein
METAGDVGDVDERHHTRIITQSVEAKALPHVTIQRDAHSIRAPYYSAVFAALHKSCLRFCIL